MESQIRQRAAEVRCMGSHIGFYEFLAWSEMQQVQVHLLFGENVVNVRRLFSPYSPMLETKPIHRIAAVRLDELGWSVHADSFEEGVQVTKEFDKLL